MCTWRMWKEALCQGLTFEFHHAILEVLGSTASTKVVRERNLQRSDILFAADAWDDGIPSDPVRSTHTISH